MATVETSTSLLLNQVQKDVLFKVLFLLTFIGLFSLAGFNTAFAAKYTQEFCTSCHEDEASTAEEPKQTIHHARRGDVPADCLDCHVLNPLVHKIIYEVQAANEFLQQLIGTIDKLEPLEKKRLRLAKHIWKTMKKSDSQNCRACHTDESMNPNFQKLESQKQHLSAFESGATCIDCHKGIAHNIRRDQFAKEEIKALEMPNPDFIRDIPKTYQAIPKLLNEVIK